MVIPMGKKEVARIEGKGSQATRQEEYTWSRVGKEIQNCDRYAGKPGIVALRKESEALEEYVMDLGIAPFTIA